METMPKRRALNTRSAVCSQYSDFNQRHLQLTQKLIGVARDKPNVPLPCSAFHSLSRFQRASIDATVERPT
ncbi:hypothetical protein AN191_03725 [Loktanella sp. 5RATIMAR09]|nr:hypothetical protein AN191_03725 [Loktanella sp. 5RATIMAR09]